MKGFKKAKYNSNPRLRGKKDWCVSVHYKGGGVKFFVESRLREAKEIAKASFVDLSVKEVRIYKLSYALHHAWKSEA